MGGYRKNSGRSKSGFYKGMFSSSTYELAWIIYNLEHNIKFERNTKGFNYEFNNKIHKYYPDFILENGDYVEIKGYERENDKAKWQQFSHKLTVLFKKDLVKIFEYVNSKYGSRIELLYEDKKYNKCLNCDKQCINKYCSHSCSHQYKAENCIYITNDIKTKRIDIKDFLIWQKEGWRKGKIISQESLENMRRLAEIRKKIKFCVVCNGIRKRSKFYCSRKCMNENRKAQVVELVDTQDLKSCEQ